MIEIQDSGGLETSEVTKSIYQRISNVIQKTFNKQHIIDSNMIKTMIKAQKCIKKIDLIKMRSEIEMIRYKNTTVPGLLWQQEHMANSYFFMVMIGYIDSLIRKEEENIYQAQEFLFTKRQCFQDQINEANQKKLQLKNQRNKIVDDYKEFINYDSFNEVLLDVLETCPSSKKFTELYGHSEANCYQLFLHQHLITAYNIGYMDISVDYNYRINKYKYLLNDLKSYQDNNQKKVAKAKIKVKK